MEQGRLIAGEASADIAEAEIEAGRFMDDFTDAAVAAGALGPYDQPPHTADMSESPDDGGPLEIFGDGPESSRSSVLPYVMMLVVGLLAGFGAAYFVFGRDRLPPSVDLPAGSSALPVTAPVAGSPATPDKAGQYSEQKVTPPAPSAAPRATPPPVPRENAAAPGSRAAESPIARTDPPARRGTLVVRSTPSRAGVVVNGEWRGRTPLTLDDLAFGKHELRVVQPGYRPAREDFTLSARSAAHTFNARLEPEGRGAAPTRGGVAASRGTEGASPTSYTGSLYVDSRPRGATVLVDGRSVGLTPLTLQNVAVGAHVVRIELIGKRPWTTSTRVASGEMARVTGSLDDQQ